jgi:hypothetical protein
MDTPKEAEEHPPADQTEEVGVDITAPKKKKKSSKPKSKRGKVCRFLSMSMTVTN